MLLVELFEENFILGVTHVFFSLEGPVNFVLFIIQMLWIVYFLLHLLVMMANVWR